jgi:hypothetical protein
MNFINFAGFSAQNCSFCGTVSGFQRRQRVADPPLKSGSINFRINFSAMLEAGFGATKSRIDAGKEPARGLAPVEPSK